MLQVAAAAGHSSAVATIATVTAAVTATWGSDKDKLGNPTEWYVADDNVSHTRYFVIQGSDSIDHWKVNLTFDPVIFEDPILGVKVKLPPAASQNNAHGGFLHGQSLSLRPCCPDLSTLHCKDA